MDKFKAKFELQYLNLLEKKNLVVTIKTSVDGNARYPQITRDKIELANNSMGIIDNKIAQRLAHWLAAKGLTTAITLEEDNFNILLGEFGNNIEGGANGDVTYFTDANVPWYLPGDGENYDVIEKPSGFEVSIGIKAGEINFTCNEVAGAKGYVLEFTLTPEDHTSYSKSKTFYKSSGTYKDLPSGKHIFIRIKAEGTHAESDFSSEICEITVP